VGNAFCHSVQIIFSSSLLSENLNIKKYKTILLPVDLYGCETWCLKLRKEYRLRVLQNRVWRRIFEPEKVKVTGGFRRLHNEELRNCVTKYY